MKPRGLALSAIIIKIVFPGMFFFIDEFFTHASFIPFSLDNNIMDI